MDRQTGSCPRVTGLGDWLLGGYAMALDGGMVALCRGHRWVDVRVGPGGF